MSATSPHRPARRLLGAAGVAAVLLAAGGCDMTVTVPLDCNVVSQLFPHVIHTSIAPDSVQRSQKVSVDFTPEWVEGRGDATVNKVEVVLPMPVDLASIDSVSFDAGDLTGAYQVAGRQLVLTFTGPAELKTFKIPTTHFTGTISPDARAGTMAWRTVSSINVYATAKDNGQDVSARCVPVDPGTVINNTNVVD